MSQTQSIRESLVKESRRLLLKLSGLVFSVSLGVGAILGLLHYEAQVNLISEGLKSNLSQLVSVGDTFQINRQINSLLRGSQVSAAWVIEGLHNTVVAQASRGDEKIPDLGPNESRLFWSGWSLRLGKSFPLMLGNQHEVGRVIFLLEPPLFALAVLSVVLALLCYLFSWVAMKRFNVLGLKITEPIVQLSQSLVMLEPGSRLEASSVQMQFKETADVWKVLERLWDKLAEFRESEVRFAKGVATEEIAKQVAHDIRSPLTALQISIRDLTNLPLQNRLLIEHAINRISAIASDLLKKDASAQTAGVEQKAALSVEHLPVLVDASVQEARIQYRSRPDLVIEWAMEGCYDLFSAVHAVEFGRVVSNLINNAAEACAEDGKIEVTLKREGENGVLIISDNGCGIPESVIPHLLDKGATYGKATGSGMGLYHAKQRVASWGGTIEIGSREGSGTRVTVTLPAAAIPSWFLDKLAIAPKSKVFIVDDDPCAHDIWSRRLADFKKRHHIVINHLDSLEEARQARKGSPNDSIFLFDFDFGRQGETGLDFICRHRSEFPNSILVTGRAFDPGLQTMCSGQRIKMVPKPAISLLPVEIV